MANLIFENTGKEVELPDGSDIKEACQEQGVPIPCSEGICGMCVIDVLEGMENLSEYTDAERDFLGEMGSERLACQCSINSGTVKVKF